MLGERVGNYVITQKLGEGGMGAVYQAEHPEIGKRVALKVLHPELAARPDIVERFFREAKVVNDIAHPNIVDIVDFGSVASARGEIVYLVMELLAGRALTSMLQGVQLDERRAIEIAMQVADALAASHGRGIVHRDLKPDNIMLVSRRREFDFVKLLDFGIAKVNDGAASKTRTGMLIGTPAYMSPEQCEGRRTIDHRTDIYALGIVLYEMLTGRVPFTGKGYAELLVMQLTHPPAPVSTLRPGISPHLEAVVLRALQKNPDDRFQTMRELAGALADPRRYVDEHGGLSTFGPAAGRSPSLIGPPPPRSGSDTGPPAPSWTTLSHSVGQLGSTVLPGPAPKRTARWLIGGAVAAVAVAGAAFAITRGDDRAKSTAQPSGEGVLATPPATPVVAPPVAAPVAPSPDPPAPPPARVKLTFETTPARAAIYVRGEPVPRCKTPCAFDLPKSDSDAEIRIKLTGFVDETRKVRANADQRVEITLTKKRAGQRDRRVERKAKSGPVGDNTLDPFE